MATAIWKDTYANNISGSFTISAGTTLIMSGMAVPKPGSATASINIARLVEDNVIHSAPSFSTGVTVTHDNAIKVFDVNGTAFTFQWDWSYTDREYNQYTAFNFPINTKSATNMLRFVTSLVNGQLMTTTQMGGNSDCGEYALYYLNRYGGWDSLLFTGKCKRKDSISALTLTQEYDNNNRSAFGLTNYYSTITPRYELNTGWLSDSQSASFAFNVIPSPMVYLHNLVENTIFPVVVENTEAEYKTRKTSDKRVSYTLNVKASQNQYINI